jgi:hypothetical protein
MKHVDGQMGRNSLLFMHSSHALYAQNTRISIATCDAVAVFSADND